MQRMPVVPVEERLQRLIRLHARPREILRAAVEHAVLAPSLYNTQPWKFRITGRSVDLFADRRRSLVIADPDDRALVIACGSALHHLRIAVRAAGHRCDVQLCPDEGNRDWLARATVDEPMEPSAIDRRMVDAMFHRRTDRRRFLDEPVNDTLLDLLVESVADAGAWFNVIRGDAERAELADLVGRADRELWSDASFRDELAAWTHARREQSRDGIPPSTFGLTGLGAHLAPALVRRFDMGQGRAAEDHEIAAGSPVLAVLGTVADQTQDRLVAGMALSAVLLRATAEGVGASFLDSPLQLAHLRPLVAGVARRPGHAQAVLRLGYARDDAAPGSPRRDVEDVLLPEG